MASLEALAPFILSFEGGYVCHPNDRGGATNRGVTISTWRRCGYDKDGDGDIDVGDLKLIGEVDVVERVMRPYYWDRCRADEIESQPIANILVDWVWASGVWGVKHAQGVLGVERDGVVGQQTLAALNSALPEELFEALHLRRRQHLRGIVSSDSTQAVFLRGWLRRLDCITYNGLIMNGGV